MRSRFTVAMLVAALALAAVALAARPASAQPPAAGASSSALDARYRSGVEAFTRGDLLHAIGALGSVAAEDAGFRDVQLLLGQVSLALGLEERALDHFQRAIAQQPGHPFAAFLLGFSLYQGSRWNEAVEAFERASALAPENPNPLVYRGLALLELGRAAEASRDIAAALERAPDDATALAAAAEVALVRGDFAGAESRLRAVLARDPEAFDARLLLARTLFEAGRAAEAAPILERLVAGAPTRSDALHLLAQSLLRSGRREEGERALERFRELKQREERMKVLEVRIKSAPEDVPARLEIIDLYLDGGHPGGVLPHLAELRRLIGAEDRRVTEITTRVERAVAARAR